MNENVLKLTDDELQALLLLLDNVDTDQDGRCCGIKLVERLGSVWVKLHKLKTIPKEVKK